MAQVEIPYTYFNRKKLKAGWKLYWRFRRDGIDTPLPGQPGEREFHDRYAELMDAAEAREQTEKAKAADRHSFAWLCDRYLASVEFEALAPATQDDYRDTIDERLRPILGSERYDCITRSSIKAIRDSVAKVLSVRTANKVKQVASLLYSWAEEETDDDGRDLLPDSFINPGMALKKLKGKSKPIEIWSPEEIDLFLAKCEEPAKTIVILALYTGQRREDLVKMEWSDCLGNMIRVRQNKTGEPLTIPCHSVLKKHLKAIRTKFGGTILRGQDGKPMNANQLSSIMNRAVAKAEGMPHRSLHGLRYAAAGSLEEVGCTFVQISSIVGHRTYQMAMKYARQRRDAEAAMARLEQLA